MIGRVLRQKNGLLGVVIAGVVFAVAVLAPVISPYDPYRIDMAASLRPPSPAHPFGTDVFGRDVMSRLMMGARISLLFSLRVSDLRSASWNCKYTAAGMPSPETRRTQNVN